MQLLCNESTIGKDAKIGPFVHLRMNATLGDKDKLVNFVEIKNSTIVEKNNISYLSYVGVNFGCGAVTVNYDGKNKHRTNIGNNVSLFNHILKYTYFRHLRHNFIN